MRYHCNIDKTSLNFKHESLDYIALHFKENYSKFYL